MKDGDLSKFLKKHQIKCLLLCRVNVPEDINKQRELIKSSAEIEISDPWRILPEYFIFYTLEEEQKVSADLHEPVNMNLHDTKDKVVLAPGRIRRARPISVAPLARSPLATHARRRAGSAKGPRSRPHAGQEEVQAARAGSLTPSDAPAAAAGLKETRELCKGLLPSAQEQISFVVEHVQQKLSSTLLQ
eukprot:745975-Hanusia_phi.AAC.2